MVAELDDAVDALQPLLEFEDAQLKNNKCSMEKRIMAQQLIEKSIYSTNTTFTLFIGLFGSRFSVRWHECCVLCVVVRFAFVVRV